MARGYGASVDEDAGLLAVADGGRLSIYDIGYGTGSPASPVQLSSRLLSSQPHANAVALFSSTPSSMCLSSSRRRRR